MNTNSRRLLWVVSVIVAFIVGYLLARRMCPDRITSSGAGDATSAKAVGPDSASASAPAPAAAAAASDASGPGAASGDSGGAGGAGGATSSTGMRAPGDSPNAAELSSGRPANTRGAPDFSLDATGLPRYPNSVTKVASTLTLQPNEPGDSASSCVIMTTDSFDTVKKWYHTHLPADWHEQSAADVQQLAKQLSPENIMKMLGAAQQAGNVPSSSPTPSPSPSAASQLSVATWSAPDNGAHSERQVMVKSMAGQPTQIEMKRTVQP